MVPRTVRKHSCCEEASRGRAAPIRRDWDNNGTAVAQLRITRMQLWGRLLLLLPLLFFLFFHLCACCILEQ